MRATTTQKARSTRRSSGRGRVGWNTRNLPEHEDLHDEARARGKGGDERADQGGDDREHPPATLTWIPALVTRESLPQIE